MLIIALLVNFDLSTSDLICVDHEDNLGLDGMYDSDLKDCDNDRTAR